MVLFRTFWGSRLKRLSFLVNFSFSHSLILVRTELKIKAPQKEKLSLSLYVLVLLYFIPNGVEETIGLSVECGIHSPTTIQLTPTLKPSPGE